MKIICPDPDNFSSKAKFFLKNKFNLTLCSPSEFLNHNSLADFDCLLIRFNTIVDENILNKLQNLQYILCPTTGLDHIDIDIAKKRRIKIISLKGDIEFLRSITSTAELAFLLILSSSRKINVSFNDASKLLKTEKNKLVDELKTIGKETGGDKMKKLKILGKLLNILGINKPVSF